MKEVWEALLLGSATSFYYEGFCDSSSRSDSSTSGGQCTFFTSDFGNLRCRETPRIESGEHSEYITCQRQNRNAITFAEGMKICRSFWTLPAITNTDDNLTLLWSVDNEYEKFDKTWIGIHTDQYFEDDAIWQENAEWHGAEDSSKCFDYLLMGEPRDSVVFDSLAGSGRNVWTREGEIEKEDPSSTIDSVSCMYPPFTNVEVHLGFVFWVDDVNNEIQTANHPNDGIGWHNAWDFCRRVVGTDLYSFHTLSDFYNTSVEWNHTFNDGSLQTWFGGEITDLGTEISKRYSDGSSVPNELFDQLYDGSYVGNYLIFTMNKTGEFIWNSSSDGEEVTSFMCDRLSLTVDSMEDTRLFLLDPKHDTNGWFASQYGRNEYCSKRFGTALIKIDDSTTNEKAMTTLNQYHCLDDSCHAFIGLKKMDNSNQYYWPDGSNYSCAAGDTWCQLSGSNGDCVAMNGLGNWTKVYCSLSSNSNHMRDMFICDAPIYTSHPTSSPTETPTTGPTQAPTESPSDHTKNPTGNPSGHSPTHSTDQPTEPPSRNPTSFPSSETQSPTEGTAENPSQPPTSETSPAPSAISSPPTASPTSTTKSPSHPTGNPGYSPTHFPDQPTESPSQNPISNSDGKESESGVSRSSIASHTIFAAVCGIAVLFAALVFAWTHQRKVKKKDDAEKRRLRKKQNSENRMKLAEVQFDDDDEDEEQMAKDTMGRVVGSPTNSRAPMLEHLEGGFEAGMLELPRSTLGQPYITPMQTNSPLSTSTPMRMTFDSAHSFGEEGEGLAS